MIDRFSALVTGHPRSVLVVLLLVTLGFASQVPRVGADFTPSDLFASFEGQQAIEDEVRATFGAVDNVVLLLVGAPDVLAVESLQWMHDVAGATRTLQGIERVDSVVSVAIPRLLPQGVYAEDGEVPPSVFLTLGGVWLHASALLPAPEQPGFLREAWTPPVGDARANSADGPSEAVAEDEGPSEAEAVGPSEAVGQGEAEAEAVGQGEADGIGQGEAEGVGTAPQLALRTGVVVRGERVSEAEAAELRLALAQAPLLQGRLINADGTLALVALTMERGLTRAADVQRLVREIEAAVADHPLPEGVTLQLSGLPYVRNVVVERMRADQSVLLPAAIGVCILILLFAFGWLPALVLPTLAVAMSALWLVGGMAIVGEPFNILNNILPMMVIIIGISNAIHVLSRYGEELREERDRARAAASAMRVMVVACFLTSFTTAVGFASLAVARTEILGRFGLTAAIGVLLAWVVTITFLPAALVLVRRPGPRALVSREGRLERWVSILARATGYFRWPIVVLAHGVLVVGLLAAGGLRIDSAVLDQFDPGDPVHQSMRTVEQELGGLRPLDVLLRVDDPARWADPAFAAAVDDVRDWALAQPGVLSGESYLELLREARVLLARDPAARALPLEDGDELARLLQVVAGAGDASPLAGYLDAERGRGRIQLRIEDMGARATLALTERLADELDRSLGDQEGVQWQLAGDAFTGSQGLDLVIRDLMGSLALAFVIIFGFLTLLLRSPRLGLLSVLPNVLPLVLTLIWMSFRGIQLNTATAIIFSISIGLAVDGTIHLLVRFREELGKGRSLQGAIDRAARGTGRAILLTCLSLILGFGIMMLSSFVPVRLFGELIAVTVAGVVVGTMVVLPALLHLFGAGVTGTPPAGSPPAGTPSAETSSVGTPHSDTPLG